MKGICENWKTCKNEDCNFHRNPHVHGAICDAPCEKDNGIKGSKCIPVQEIKYKTEGSGYCLTECEYIDDIKIGSIGCEDCKHCVERDPFNKIVTCTHPKGDKVELYICDKAGDNALRNIPVKAIPYKNEEKKMAKQEMPTYKMEMTCSNCGHKFMINIPRGEKVPTLSTCTYCGWYGVNHGRKPYNPAEGMMGVGPGMGFWG